MLLVKKIFIFPPFFLRHYRPGKGLLRYSRTKKKKAFLGHKNKKFIKSKNWHFSKAVNPWFWSKDGHFWKFFLGNIGQENVFYDILKRKNASLGKKKQQVYSGRKIHIFSQGLTHGLGPKMARFSNLFFLRNRGQENVFYDILERKNAVLGYKDKKFKKSKNWQFSNGVNSWFWSKDPHFSNFFFLGNIGYENVFYDILEQKNAVLGYKHKWFKKSKNWQFCNGVNSWFWSKNPHFSNFFFLGNIDQENVFYDILERKNAFVGQENKNFKLSKNWHFFMVLV